MFAIALGILFSFNQVDAKEIYFTNSKGVSMTEEEYQFIGELYKEGFQNHITQELYDNIIDNNLMERELNKKTVIHQDNPFARGSYHTTSYKELSITSSCNSTNCYIVITLDENDVINEFGDIDVSDYYSFKAQMKDENYICK